MAASEARAGRSVAGGSIKCTERKREEMGAKNLTRHSPFPDCQTAEEHTNQARAKCSVHILGSKS